MAGGGKIGVVIFFSISAWFFLDREQTIKSNLKRVWIMERELLFYSLILVAFYLVFDRADLGAKLMVKSFAPLSTGGLVVRYRLRHLPSAPPLPLQGIEGARPRIPSRAGRDRTGHLGIAEFHSRTAIADRQCFRLHLRVHPHFRLQVAYDAVHHQAGLADDRHRAWFLPSLYRRVRNAVPAGARHGNLHHRQLETARHHGGLRRVPIVRPRHLP